MNNRSLNIPDHKTKLILAFITAILGILLLFVGLIIPPIGVIDSSVLIAAGEILVFSGSVLGLKINYDIQLGKLLSRLNEKEKEKEA